MRDYRQTLDSIEKKVWYRKAFHAAFACLCDGAWKVAAVKVACIA
jgi:hypothetical protein